MNCEDTRHLLHAYVDKELDAANARAVEQHTGNCSACRLELRSLQSLQITIQEHGPYFTMPEELRESILDSLQGKATGEPTRKRTGRVKILVSLAAAATVAFLAITSLMHYFHDLQEKALIRDIMADHTKTLQSKQLSDIAITDIRSVKPWLLGKLDYAPEVIDLSQSGYTLAGARLDYFQHQKVAALAYQSGGKVINLYTWPSRDVDDNPVEHFREKGYNLVYWCQNRMNYWIITDADTRQLQQFTAQYRAMLDRGQKK